MSLTARVTACACLALLGGIVYSARVFCGQALHPTREAGGRPASGLLEQSATPTFQHSARFWSKRVGSCRLVKWTNWGHKDGQRQTLFLRDASGRTIARFSDFGADVDEWPHAPRRMGKVLLFTTWSGGAHGSNCYYLYAVGPHPRCLLAYRKGNVLDVEDFEPVDLDGDGVPEIVTWYDGFAYGGGLPGLEYSYAGSAQIPLALHLEHGRYVEASGQFRTWLREKLASDWRDCRLATRPSAPARPDAPHRLVECYCIERLLHPRPIARRNVYRRLRARERAVLHAHEADVERGLAKRQLRFAYPEPYGRMPDWDFTTSPP